MTYASASDVALYCPEPLGEGQEFSDTSAPTLEQVNRFLAMGYSRINGALAAYGYTVPVSSGADVYDQLTDLEALYAAARVQLARMSARLGPDERGKSEVLMGQFRKDLDALLKIDLSRAGLTPTSKLYAGGISVSDKESVAGDSDRVKPRFERGQFRYPGAAGPTGTAEDDEGD
jgi:hypothetical protein